MDMSAISGMMGGGGGGGGWGSALSGVTQMFGGIISGVQKANAGRQQMVEGKNLLKQALAQKAEKMSPEFMQRYNADRMRSLGNMAGYGQAQEQLDVNTANSIRSILDASPNGAAALAAISAAIGSQNSQQNLLTANNLAYKDKMVGNVIGDISTNAIERSRLEDIRRLKQKEMQTQAGALVNAGTANKQMGNDLINTSITNGITSAVGGGGGGQSSQNVNSAQVQQPMQSYQANSYQSAPYVRTWAAQPQSLPNAPQQTGQTVSVNQNPYWLYSW